MSATFSIKQGRGKLFVKGQAKIASSGRRKGVPNTTTTAIKKMIECAAMKLGGVERLCEWAKEDPRNEFAFWCTIWPRLLPLQIAGTGERGEIEMNVRLSAEELAQQLQKRGLPAVVFGIDKPVLELESRRIEGNGSSAAPEGGNIGADVDPAPMLEAMEEQICAPDSAERERRFLEARMAAHIERYGGST
jgi:hypothetical protein